MITPTNHTLILERQLQVSPHLLWRCWTEAALLQRWFCPLPWRVTEAVLDVRPGGSSLIVMQGPQGEVVPNRGVYLEVEPERRLVFTDAYVSAWEPSAQPFFTGVIAFIPNEGGTLYRAEARHWTAEACAQHEAMGFHSGWSQATEQLMALSTELGRSSNG